MAVVAVGAPTCTMAVAAVAEEAAESEGAAAAADVEATEARRAVIAAESCCDRNASRSKHAAPRASPPT